MGLARLHKVPKSELIGYTTINESGNHDVSHKVALKVRSLTITCGVQIIHGLIETVLLFIRKQNTYDTFVDEDWQVASLENLDLIALQD
jgi:hypothetical protein